VWQQGRATSGLARAYLYLDKRDLATAAFKSALTCCRQVGDREGECRTLGLMGRIESRYGRIAQAELHFQDALDCYRDQELPGRFAWVLASRTEIYLRWGRLADAERCARGALSIANSRGTPAERSVAEFNLGMLLLEMGSTNRAQSHITKSKRVAEALGLSRFLGDVLMGLSWVHFDKGEYPRAEAYWTQASEIHVQTRNTLYQGVVHGIRGLCALGEGRTETAIEALQEAIESPALDTRSALFFSLALTVAHDKANAHDAARLCLTSIAAMKPNHQIDSAAGQIIAAHLDRWLMSDRSEKAGRALSEQIALCRRPASPDLCAATACSSELRWILHLIEKHLSAG
jgi:tetratricopeptide (TPR) repeat protein